MSSNNKIINLLNFFIVKDHHNIDQCDLRVQKSCFKIAITNLRNNVEILQCTRVTAIADFALKINREVPL